MENHTKGTFIVRRNGNNVSKATHIQSSEGKIIIAHVYGYDESIEMANAERIAACLNACQEYTTDSLKTTAGVLKRVESVTEQRANALEEQNRKLASALLDAQHYLRFSHASDDAVMLKIQLALDSIDTNAILEADNQPKSSEMSPS